MANKPKFIYLNKNVSDSKAWLKTQNNNNEWNNSDNDFYRSLVFTQDGHLLIHGLDIYNPTSNLGCGLLINQTNGNTIAMPGDGVPVLFSVKVDNTPALQTVSFRQIKETYGNGLSDSSNQLITEKAVKEAINASFAANDAMIYRGVYTAKGQPDNNATTVDLNGFETQPGETSLGWTWIVSGVDSTNKYFGNIEVENGDMIVAKVDNPGTSVNNYNVIQTNLVNALTKDVFTTYFSQTYQDLSAIESLSGTSGFLKKTANNTWSLYSIAAQENGGITITDSNSALTISLKTAKTDEIGGIKVQNAIGQSGTNPTLEAVSTTQSRYYGLQVDKNGLAFVNIPWINTWRDIKAWRFSEMGNNNDQIDAIFDNTSTSINTSTLTFGQSFAAIQSAQNGPATIELIWADVASDGTITYHY